MVVNVPTAFAVGEPDAFIFDVAETTIAVTMKDVSMSINSVGTRESIPFCLMAGSRS